MPTTYAHWRFGCDCIETLPEELKKTVNDNRELFDIGVHGPDIFFYDLLHKEIADYGHMMHSQSAKTFFAQAAKTYQQYDDDKEAMLSYLLGFLSHFTLDSQCHGYVNRKDDLFKELTHNKIETEFDAHLMRLDNKDVARTDRSESLKPSHRNSAIISRFFPHSEKQIYTAISAHRTIISFLVCKRGFKRRTLNRLLRQLNFDKHADLLVQTKEDPLCKDANLRLTKLKDYALELYPKLVNELMDDINNGAELGAYFDNIFDPRDDSIPVLSYEEEQGFIPEKNI